MSDADALLPPWADPVRGVSGERAVAYAITGQALSGVGGDE